MYKIIINSLPRSGSNFLFSLARSMYSHDIRDANDHSVSGEWHQTDNWIINAHEPLLFRSNIPDATMTTILRDPIDVISSQILKSTYGFSPKTIAGRQEIVDANMDFLRDNKEKHLQESMYQECRMWSGYAYGSRLAIDRIVPYTFEQLTKETPMVLSSLYNLAGGSESYRHIDERYVSTFIEQATENAKNDIAFTSGASNGLPTEKPQEYYVIREAVKNYKMIPDILEEYEETKKLFEKRQTDLGLFRV